MEQIFELDPQNPWSYLRGFQPYSFCDWPSKLSCVLFLGSCNLRCPTCHNSKLAWNPETLSPISREKIYSFLNTKKEWLDGIAISGGEPTCTPYLYSLLSELSGFGLGLKLDTNGLKPEIIKTLLEEGLLEMLSVDVKGPWFKYPVLSGNMCSPEEARQSLESIFEMSGNYNCYFQFRCTQVPELTEQDIQEVKSLLPRDSVLCLQDYLPN